MTNRFLHAVTICASIATLLLVIPLSGCDGPQSALPGLETPGEKDDPNDGAGETPEEPPVEEPPAEDPPEPLTTTVAVDFQSAVAGITALSFDGSGFAAEPEEGQLDSDSWSVLGFSDGDLAFSDEVSTGDLARGTSPGGVTTGGLYAFLVEQDNVALGVQPTASDFAPGSILFRPNAPGNLVRCDLTCTTWTLNDEDRATSITVSYSVDGENWIPVDSMSCTTDALSDSEPAWTATALSGSVALGDSDRSPDGDFILRWDAEDSGGTGSRDEWAIDDLGITFTFHEQ